MVKTQSLITIETDALALEALILESGGELCPALESFMAEIETALATKCDSYAAVYDRFESEAKTFRERAETFRAAAKSMEAASERLKTRIFETMTKLGLEEINGGSWRWKIQNSPASMVIDPNFIPKEYEIIKTEIVYDKDKIKADMAAGTLVEGVTLTQGKHVRKYIAKGSKK